MKQSVRSYVRIRQSAYNDLLEYCSHQLPLEACGVMVAVDDVIEMIIPITNIHPDPKSSFYFDPQHWIEAYYHIQKNRQQIVGLFHSHPTSAPVPSSLDVSGFELGMNTSTSLLSYWIVSNLYAADPLVQVYQMNKEAFIPLMFTKVCV